MAASADRSCESLDQWRLRPRSERCEVDCHIGSTP